MSGKKMKTPVPKMKTCQRCGSVRVIYIQGHCIDSFYATIIDNSTKKEYDGYVPHDAGIGGGDDIEIEYCANCGQIQGKFPVPATFFDQEPEDE